MRGQQYCFENAWMPFSPQNSDPLSQADCDNLLLKSLPAEDYEPLSPYLTPVNLTLGHILYEPGEMMHTAFFPASSMISFVKVMADGATIEAGVAGHYGVVDCAIFLDGQRSSSRAVVQIAGRAIALDAAVLRSEFNRHGALYDLLLRYSQAFIAQIGQTAACNRFHMAEERLARWLLQSQDALRSSHLELTQGFLSSMLGTRRASVTLAAGRLQQAGLIRYSRGNIEILDREGLESTACECYEVVRDEYTRLLSK